MTAPESPAAERAELPESLVATIESYATSYDQMADMGDGRILALCVAYDIRTNIITAIRTALKSIIAQKDAEIARLKKKLAWQEECQQAEFVAGNKRAEQAERRVAELMAALTRYGDHDPNCTNGGVKCSCGFTEALKEPK